MKKFYSAITALLIALPVLISCSGDKTESALSDSIESSTKETNLISQQDSATLKQHIREAKIMYAIEEFSEHSFNGKYDDAQLDSLLNEQHMSFASARYIYAPDSSFVIYIIEMESCGAYCNPLWETWIHFNDESRYIYKSTEISNVVEINKMPDGKYMLVESASTRPAGFYTQTAFNVSLVTFPEHNITFHPVVCESVKADADRFDKRFSIHQEFTMDEFTDFTLNYTANTETLEYTYANDMNICCNVDSAYEWTGKMLYTNGCFKKLNESRRALK
ncbi:MAG: hypothetical protein RL007_1865 [Bacteroidota bacterium]|jgi:hypothetical protein